MKKKGDRQNGTWENSFPGFDRGEVFVAPKPEPKAKSATKDNLSMKNKTKQAAASTQESNGHTNRVASLFPNKEPGGKPRMTSKVEFVTPEIAARYLELNTRNRKIRRNKARIFADIIREARENGILLIKEWLSTKAES